MRPFGDALLNMKSFGLVILSEYEFQSRRIRTFVEHDNCLSIVSRFYDTRLHLRVLGSLICGDFFFSPRGLL